MSYSAKRRYPRAMFPARVIVHNDEEVAYLKSGTISEGGMSLTTPGPIFTPGTILKLNIKSPDMPKTFLAEGEVINYLKNKKDQNLCLKFINISDSDKLDIRKFVSKNSQGSIKVTVIPENSLSIPKPTARKVKQQLKTPPVPKKPIEVKQQLKHVAQEQPIEEVKSHLKLVENQEEQNHPIKPKVPEMDFGQMNSPIAEAHREIENFDDFSSLIQAYDRKSEVTTSEDNGELKVKTELTLKLPERDKELTQNVYCSPLKLPNERTFEVYLNGEKVPHSKINGWYFDNQKLLIKFSGRYKPTSGSIIQFGCVYDPED